MKKIMIIANPSSGKEQSEEYIEKLKSILSETTQEIKVNKTKEKGDAENYAHKAAEEDFDTVIAMGGDGTMHEVVNGLRKNDQSTALGIVPLGTVNNFAKALGIPNDPLEAIEVFSDAQIVPIDTGRINDTYFVSSVSAGPIPETVQHVDSEMKTTFGPLAYFIQGVKALDQETVYPFTLLFDGKEVKEQYSLMIIALSNSVAGIQNFIPEATIEDGKLYFLGLKETNLHQKLVLVPMLFQNHADYSDQVDMIPFSKAQIRLDKENDLKTTIDGEVGLSFPAEVEVFPHSLNVLIPAKSTVVEE
ncbi:lipid kinase, YegS/Rv2252/BmrU family [Desemzia incerta]|uniref:Lipid kinase, YegS/Rv2252/BmrU family n=1 Tax=Desemzia incerta TaxID=82801 RepID=A0A1I5VG59_9LACT|nr:diacylglycerol kinase family protein [Desemzia incerta]SFQ06453.1 lipid kinase, YegS/Rv2252/BmrU family [Desemzia incerta]